MVSLVGDYHNFAQAVRRITTPDGSEYFEKPRSLFWEWIFFGCDSPLKKYFNGVDKSIFNLKINFYDDRFYGRVEKVLQQNFSEMQDKKIQSFGFLLGYCYAFGIQDLHKENLLTTVHGTQAVDVETVFAKFVLPNESLLLPFKDTVFEKSGLSVVVNSFDDIPPEYTFQLLKGFIAALITIERNADKILKDISAAICSKDIPIRVILRDTSKYRNWKTVVFEPPLLKEEVEQLERGDVPYFFKYIGSASLFYFTTSYGKYEPAELSDYFKEKVNRIGMDPKVLLCSSRIQKELFPNGILFLLKKLLPANFETVSKISDVEIVWTKESRQICSKWGIFRI